MLISSPLSMIKSCFSPEDDFAEDQDDPTAEADFM